MFFAVFGARRLALVLAAFTLAATLVPVSTPAPAQAYTTQAGAGTRVPDFVKLAEAMGCIGIRCEDPADLDAVIEKANAINDRPVVVDFIVHEDAMVWPMVAAGTSNDEIQAARGVRPDFGDSEDD